MVDYGPTVALGGPSAHSAAGNGASEAPTPSGSLTLARRYVLDPGTRIDTVNIGPSRWGRRSIVIALEVADGV